MRMPVFYAKRELSLKERMNEFISSLIPVSTKDLYFGRVEEVIKKPNYFLKVLKPSYVIVHKMENYLGETIFEDAINKDIYNNEDYIKTNRLFGSEETVKELFPVITEKTYISRKALEAMFNEYVRKQSRKRLCANKKSGVKANEKVA